MSTVPIHHENRSLDKIVKRIEEFENDGFDFLEVQENILDGKIKENGEDDDKIFIDFAEGIFQEISENTNEFDNGESIMPTLYPNNLDDNIIEELFKELEYYNTNDDWVNGKRDEQEDFLNGEENDKNFNGNISEILFEDKKYNEICWQKGKAEKDEIVMDTEVLEDDYTMSSSEKLTSEQTKYLIQLYRNERCLWNEIDPNFCNALAIKRAWQNITDQFNKNLITRKFRRSDIRIKISNLCRNYMKQKERFLQQTGEDEKCLDNMKLRRFQYYNEMDFLEQQDSLRRRRELYDEQNRKILEIYRYFPLLWHRRYYKLKYTHHREKAWQNIGVAMRVYGFNMTQYSLQQRVRSLRKCYRLEKIRYMQAIRQKYSDDYEASFKYYKTMDFLHDHIDPYYCRNCQEIYENLWKFREHFKTYCKKQTNDDHDDDNNNDDHILTLPFDDNTLNGNKQEEVVPIRIQLEYDNNVIEMDLYRDDRNDNDNHDDNENNEKNQPHNRINCDNSFIRLNEREAHELINLYKNYPELWDPNHDDYKKRIRRQEVWQLLTYKYNELMNRQYNCKILHRKINDYIKYYKKEKSRQREKYNNNNEVSNAKWILYEDFQFLDDVLNMNQNEQKYLQNKEEIFKIIDLYKTLPQLWDINHPDYNKHSSKQRNIKLMCNELQRQYRMNIKPERLRQRLSDLKSQYRKLKEQLKMHELKCNYVNKEFDDEYYEKLNFLDPNIAPFKCNICEIEFNIYKEYNKHRKAHCGEKRNGERGTALKGNSINNVCHVCGATFTLRSNLMVHLKRHNGIQNYPCSRCTKRFYNSHTLAIHERSHTKQKPFTCEQCGRSFCDKSKLNLHLKRHTDRRDFHCDYCPRAFFTAYERDYHIRRHLNIRDKVCKVCGKTFIAGSALYAHIMLHNEVKRYECDACEMKFSQYAGLYKHKKKHHQ